MKKINITTVLIIILIVATGILVYLLAFPSGKTLQISKSTAPTQTPLKKTTTLAFNPQHMNISSTSAVASTDLIVDTDSDEISGVQAELTYDPKSITNVKIVPATGKDGLS